MLRLKNLHARRRRRYGSAGPVPFIVGASRSGTTLLRMMLDAHPLLAIPPETGFIPAAARVWKRSPAPREDFFKTVVTHPNWREFQVDPETLRQRLAAAKPAGLGEALRVFYQLYADRFNKPRWGDKTPGYVRWMTKIQRLLPEVRFIHIIRDGRDVAISIRHLDFGPSSAVEAAEWWVRRIEKARRQAGDLRHYLEVRYEDLVRDPEPHLRGICEFLELSFAEVMLDYHERAGERLMEIAPERRIGFFDFVDKPPQAARIGRWKGEMSESERRQFETIAGPLLEELGYKSTAD
jgi:hypothetical protein